MPWELLTPMSQRKEFVSLALTDGANMARLCRRLEISRKIGYKRLARYRATGEAGLADRSRRPHRSPGETKEALVAAVRTAHPAWGGRKIRFRLQAQGWSEAPAASTITDILRRHGLINPERPHEALGMAVPMSRYRESPRIFPETIPPLVYGPGDQVRKVQALGWITFRGRYFRLSKAFRGELVGCGPRSPTACGRSILVSTALPGSTSGKRRSPTEKTWGPAPRPPELIALGATRGAGEKRAEPPGPAPQYAPRSALRSLSSVALSSAGEGCVITERQGNAMKNSCDRIDKLEEPCGLTLKSVTYVSEHLLPISPVQTPSRGEGINNVISTGYEPGVRVGPSEGQGILDFLRDHHI